MQDHKVTITSYDGLELPGAVLKAARERAGVLFVHGITSSMDELGFHLDYARHLCAHGFTSLRFNYRYHGGEDTALANLTLGGIVNDVDAAFSTLKAHVDPLTTSFFVIGTSFGGGLCAFWMDYFDRKEVKKLLLNAPVIDYEDDVLGRNKLLRNGKLAERAQSQLDQQGYVVSSGIQFGRGMINELRYLNGIAPLQRLGDRVTIFHGDADEDVPLSSSQRYHHPDSRLQIIKGVGHGFGIDIDEDLTHPRTKEIHHNIYAGAQKLMEASL